MEDNYNYIWSESDLREMIDRAEPQVREWAVGAYFSLYPDPAGREAADFLRSGNPAVVRTVLNLPAREQDEMREDLLPVLKEIFMDGPPEFSASAVRLPGIWGSGEAVEWIEESILAGKTLTGEQIDAIIEALGSIESERAYALLEKAEEGIDTHSLHGWKSVYRALLKHRKAKDVETVLRIFLNTGIREEHRRSALDLLAEHVAPGMKPTSISLGLHPIAADYLEKRLRYLKSEIHSLPERGDLPSYVDALQELLHDFQPDSLQDGVEFLRTREEPGEIEESSRHEWEVFRIMKDSLGDSAHSPEDLPPLFMLAACALVGALTRTYAPVPPEDAGWKALLADLLRDRYEESSDRVRRNRILKEAPTSELVAVLTDALSNRSAGWGAARAVQMLGRLRAVESAPAIVRSLERNQDGFFYGEARKALIRMGPGVVREVIPLLDSPDPARSGLALGVLAGVPVPESVRELAARLPALLDSRREDCLDAIDTMPAGEFLPALASEYRPGEWELAEMLVLISKVNGLNPPNLREVEQDLRSGREYRKARRKIETGDFSRWPDSLRLNMLCRACGKQYHYLARQVHLHLQMEDPKEGEVPREPDMTPYRHGIVVNDDLQCKNCGRVNDMELTQEAVSAVAGESIRLLYYHQMGLSVPQHYPAQMVKFGEKDGKPQTLSQLEEEYLQAIGRQPSKTQGHITLGKFYEYVKQHRKARDSYLKAIDLDAAALEAMAGLARLCHAEGRHAEAFEWIESCYDNLSGGNLYLAPDPRDFKKVVREKRREFARTAGIRLKDEPVEIRFKAEDAVEHPRNQPCPCGSGKKYKLCCMKKERA